MNNILIHVFLMGIDHSNPYIHNTTVLCNIIRMMDVSQNTNTLLYKGPGLDAGADCGVSCGAVADLGGFQRFPLKSPFATTAHISQTRSADLLSISC